MAITLCSNILPLLFCQINFWQSQCIHKWQGSCIWNEPEQAFFMASFIEIHILLICGAYHFLLICRDLLLILDIMSLSRPFNMWYEFTIPIKYKVFYVRVCMWEASITVNVDGPDLGHLISAHNVHVRLLQTSRKHTQLFIELLTLRLHTSNVICQQGVTTGSISGGPGSLSRDKAVCQSSSFKYENIVSPNSVMYTGWLLPLCCKCGQEIWSWAVSFAII